MNEEYYYIIENGKRRGPFTGAALRLMGVKPDTLIWRPGVSDWVKVSDLEEAADLLKQDESAFGSYAEQPPYGGQAPHMNGAYHQWAPGQETYAGHRRPKPHTDWAPWAIAGIVLGLCSCIGLIFGLIGLMNANKANAYYIAGDDINGDIANSSAKSMTLVSLIIGGIGLVGGVISGILNTLIINWG